MAAPTVVSADELSVIVTGLASPAPEICTLAAPVVGVKLVAEVRVSPPVTVVEMAVPVEPEDRLPISALAIWSPASTWNAEVLELKDSSWPPLASVLTEAVMLAPFKA